MTTQASGSHQRQRNLKSRLAELEQRSSLLEHVLNGLPQGVRVVDQDLNLLIANRAAYEQSLPSTAEPNGKCYHYAGLKEPCERCPVVQLALSTPALYALQVQPAQEGRSDDVLSPCALLSVIDVPAASSSAGEAAATASPAKVDGDRLGRLIGRSEPMRHLFEMIKLVAPSDATVLLEGESGTGKEMVARSIHALSRRRDRPFVVIDCGALPETLLESELFGHVKGAFTGAVSAKPGLFEEAEGGTIFLDEISDMSPALQAKLLRVLQDGEIKPVGWTRRIKVDVRVIAASNKAMAPLVANKAFREDLYYRLAVIPLAIPPLRRRREDIPLLLECFIAEFCERYGKEDLVIAPEAAKLLTDHTWPGNVRELRHVIERAVLTSPGSELAADRLFADLYGAPVTARTMLSLKDEMQDAVRLLERVRIVEALNHAKGNRVQAARSLKISRASFYNKLRDYQILATDTTKAPAPMCHTRDRAV
jgi:two-component system, NtrC family, response regulator HydG